MHLGLGQFEKDENTIKRIKKKSIVSLVSLIFPHHYAEEVLEHNVCCCQTIILKLLNGLTFFGASLEL